MGFSLTKEHLDRLEEKLHVIDELHARAGGVEPVDPKETFFEALKKEKLTFPVLKLVKKIFS